MKTSSGSRLAQNPSHKSRTPIHKTNLTKFTTPLLRTQANQSHIVTKQRYEVTVKTGITSRNPQVCIHDTTHPLETTIQRTSWEWTQGAVCATTVPRVVRISRNSGTRTLIATGATRAWTAIGWINRSVATTATIATSHPTSVTRCIPRTDTSRYVWVYLVLSTTWCWKFTHNTRIEQWNTMYTLIRNKKYWFNWNYLSLCLLTFMTTSLPQDESHLSFKIMFHVGSLNRPEVG